MTDMNTQWRITVAADTAAARSELGKLAATAKTMGASMEQMFSNVKGAPVARTFNNLGRELDRMNTAVMKGKTQLSSFNRYWRNSNNLIRHSKQLQHANYVALEKTNGAMTSATMTMQKFNSYTATGAERLAYMNTWFKTSSRQALNWAKNIQWAGRQILVGFGVPFGLAMTGAAMAFLDFEEQLVRFRKVFNDELSDLSIEEAEERITSLANTMATSLGVARDEVMETSALFAQMGYGVDEIERLTKATTELAMLGETDAQEAGKLLRAYSASGFVDTFVQAGGSRDEFEDYIKNMLNMIENNTGLSIASMVEAGMAQLIPLFSQMGVGAGIGESILAGMTEALGGRTSEAVTALKAIMQRVYDESAETTEQFGFLGVDIQALQEKYKSDFVGLIEELGSILANNPAIQGNNKAVAETFGNLFGVRQANRAIAGLKAVSSAFNSSGDAVNDYGRALNAIQDPQEAASRAAAELSAQAESVGGRLRRLKETIMIAASDVGETFLEMIMPLAEQVGKFIEWFTGLRESTKRFVIGLGGAVVALSALLTTVGVLSQAFIYMLRTISAMLPKFNLFNESTKKQQIALDHLDEGLKHLRTSMGTLEPMYESIEHAQREARIQTEALTASIREQSVAMNNLQASAGGAKAVAPGSQMNYGELQSRYGLQRAAARGEAGVQLGAVPTGPGFAKAPLSGAARQSKQAMYDRLFVTGFDDPEKLTGMNRRVAMARQRNNNVINGPGSSMKWRRGAGLAGGLMMGGGMLAGGPVGNAMMGAGMGVETFAMLGGGKMKQRVAELSNSLLDMADNSGKIKGNFQKTAGSMLSLVTKGPVLAGIAAAVAGSAFLISRRIENTRKEAAMLRSEFEVAAAVGEELGLQLEDVSTGLDLSQGPTKEEVESMSEEMQTMVRKFQDAETQGEAYVRSTARNMARQWERGGASVEEINEKLKELEAIVDVKIDPVSSEELAETVGQDISRAITMSMAQFSPNDFIFNWFTDKEFTGDQEERIFGSAMATTQSIMNNPEGAAGNVDQFTFMLENNPAVGANEFEDAMRRYMDFLAAQNQLSEHVAAQAENAHELVGIIMQADIEKTLRMGEELTDQQREMWDISQELTGGKTYFFNDEDVLRSEQIVNNIQRAREFGVGDEIDLFNLDSAEGVRRAMGTITSEARSLVESLEFGGVRWNEFETTGENLERIMQSNNETAAAHAGKLQQMAILWQLLNGQAAAYDNTIRGLPKKINQPKPFDPADYPHLQSGSDSEGSQMAEEAGEDHAESYINSFRSELDRKRADVIKEILSQYDEATEEIIEGIEEQRDAEIDSLDERIEKIDDYIERQEEIADALQQQIDLNVALASGDRGAAAQIQNAMRFGEVEKMAEEAKDSIEEEKKQVDELYDDRIKREEELREIQRENLEENLRELEQMFIGTRASWDAFYNAAQTEASNVGLTLGNGMRGQFDEAMDAVVNDARLDSVWRNTDFSELRNRLEPFLEQVAEDFGTKLAGSTSEGLTTGLMKETVTDAWTRRLNIQAGQQIAILEATLTDPEVWHSVDERTRTAAIQWGLDTGKYGIEAIDAIVKAMDEWGQERMEASAEHSAVLYGSHDPSPPEDQTSSTPSNYYDPDIGSTSGGFTYRHSGGPIGGGPPRDVPAMLQTGEYVIQRKAAEALGRDYLDMLNNYHIGGPVMGGVAAGKAAESWAQMLGAMAGGSGRLSAEDRDATWRYSSWMENMQPNVVRSFANALAQLPGSQIITSAYRSPEENRRVGGAPNSDHTKGKGVDFKSATNNSLSNLNRMGSYFQGLSGVRWVGMPKTDASGGHNDHVHVSYYHNGGLVGKGGGKRVQVPSKPLPGGRNSLQVNSGGVTLNIGEFHGTEENIDLLAQRVSEAISRKERRVNPMRRVG